MTSELRRLKKVLSLIEYRSWGILAAQDPNGRLWIQLRFLGLDPKLLKMMWQKGRKWLVSQHATNSEIVQTVLKAVLTAEEHEVREHFKYRDRAIFATHFDVERLVELVGQEDCEERRPEREKSGIM